jgi:hypothetical protein
VKRKSIREKGKVRLDLVPASALHEAALAHAQGNTKPGRGPFNWRARDVHSGDMISAALRHIQAWQEGCIADDESDAHPLGHAIARLAIVIDAEAHGHLIDERPCRVAKKRRR